MANKETPVRYRPDPHTSGRSKPATGRRGGVFPGQGHSYEDVSWICLKIGYLSLSIIYIYRLTIILPSKSFIWGPYTIFRQIQWFLQVF